MSKPVKNTLFILLLVLGACTAQTNNSIKIGFVSPLTGEAATYGTDDKNAVLLALEDINSAGGINGRPLEVVFEDSKCEPKTAATAASKLVDVDKVKIILGSECSGDTLAMAPITEQNKVLLFSAGATNPDVRNAGDYVFRNVPSDELTGKQLAETLSVRNARVAIITEDTDYGQGLRKVFVENAQRLNLPMIADEVYNAGTTDYRAQLSKIKSTDADTLFINPQADAAAARILRQANELGLSTKYAMIYMAGSDSVKEAIKQENITNLLWVYYPELNSPEGIALVKRHEQKFGTKQNYNIWMAVSYDRTRILANALKQCGEDTSCIKDWLYAIPPYKGVTGTVSFDDKGDVLGLHHAVFELQGNETVQIV